MKILSKLKERSGRGLDRMSAWFYRARVSASRGLSMLVVALVVLLLLDVGFVLVQTSVPAGAVAGARQSVAEGAQHAAASLTPVAQSAAAATVTAARKSANPFTAAATKALPPRIVETPLSEPDIRAISVEPTPVLCENPIGQLITDTIDSKVLARSLQVHVYVPPCYNPGKYVYPALYLIQGSAYRFGEWVEDGVPRIADLHMSLGILPPFLIVMPASDLEGGNRSKYTYSVKGKGSWEDFMVNELAPMIDKKYGAWQDREGRAIGGISRGGYWSLQIGFANPDKFSAVGGHSPSIMPDKLIGTPANFSMLSLAKSITDLNTVRIYLDAGATDWAQSGVKRLSSDLDARKIPYTVSSGEGGHEDAYWASRVADYLAFYSARWPRIARARPVNMGAASDSPRTQP